MLCVPVKLNTSGNKPVAVNHAGLSVLKCAISPPGNGNDQDAVKLQTDRCRSLGWSHQKPFVSIGKYIYMCRYLAGKFFMFYRNYILHEFYIKSFQCEEQSLTVVTRRLWFFSFSFKIIFIKIKKQNLKQTLQITLNWTQLQNILSSKLLTV